MGLMWLNGYSGHKTGSHLMRKDRIFVDKIVNG